MDVRIYLDQETEDIFKGLLNELRVEIRGQEVLRVYRLIFDLKKLNVSIEKILEEKILTSP